MSSTQNVPSSASAVRQTADAKVSRNPRMSLVVKFLAGPFFFMLVHLLPLADLRPGGKVVLATLIWCMVWWILRPISWGATALLPLVIFPLTQTLSIQETARLYGQTIFFWIMGFSLLGYAIIKHGLAKRFAFYFLSIPGIGTSTYRLLFFFMMAAGFISWFVGHLSTIALMIPLGTALQASVRARAGSASTPGTGELAGEKQSHLGTSFALGTLYSTLAGGAATIAGAPHNAVALAQYEALTKGSIGWFSWMMLGVPTFFTMILLSYFLLLWFFKPEIRTIPGGTDLLREERRALGPMTSGEKYVLAILLVAIALFTLPALFSSVLGGQDPLTQWVGKTISIWLASPVVLLLLFGVPTDVKKKEFVVNWKEGASRLPLEIMFLVTCGVGLVNALDRFGFVKMLTDMIHEAHISPTLFPYFTGLVTSASTIFMQGTAVSTMYSTMLIPVAQHIGFNPAAVAVLVGSTSVGVIFPWSGATTATAFSFGEVSLKDLIRVGVVAQLIMIATASTYALLIGRLL